MTKPAGIRSPKNGSRRRCLAKLLVPTSNMCYCCTFPCRLVSNLSEEGGVSWSAEKAGEGRGGVGEKKGLSRAFIIAIHVWIVLFCMCDRPHVV